jgi:peptidoglycan hydrolase CwlO-like protein
MKKCLALYEYKSQQYDNSVREYQGKAKTLNNEIGSIDAKIKSLNSQISKNSVMIKDLGMQVEKTKSSISETDMQIGSLKDRMQDILQMIYTQDEKSPIEIFLSGQTLMDAFDEYVALREFSLQNEDLVNDSLKLKDYLEAQKLKLGTQKDKLEDTVSEQQTQKQQSATLKNQKSVVLQETKGQEALYKNYKAQADAAAAKIRAQIFKLAGISGVSQAPDFGQALEIAKMVGGKVGVRPAFILGILAQETRIGKVLGGCYVKDASGSGVMRPTQVPSFIKICNDAGLDYTKMPVSCPAPNIGCTYGGAMGPAQFIPTTWDLFKDKVAGFTGRAANPWNVEDAFYACGLFLQDAGANSSGGGEQKAAARYFGTGIYGYPQGVKQRADCIQTFIDSGTMSAYCQGLIF